MYDSFEGFPDPTLGDQTHGHVAKSAFRGNVRSAEQDVVDNFKRSGLPAPTKMHKGFFGASVCLLRGSLQGGSQGKGGRPAEERT